MYLFVPGTFVKEYVLCMVRPSNVRSVLCNKLSIFVVVRFSTTFTIIGTAVLKARLAQLVKERGIGRRSPGTCLLPAMK